MRKLESFVQLLSGRFNNAPQYEAQKGEGFHSAEHVNTPCNHQSRGLPADFDGVFLLEESYYTTDGRTHASPHLFLFTEEAEGVRLTSYEVPASCPKDCLFLGDVEENDLFLIEAEALSDRPGEYPFLQEYTGISRPHQGIRELREAYLEAREMRRCAFCTNRSQMRYGQEMPRVPQKLVQEASKLVADEMKLQRVQLLGTDRTEELQHVWTQFFYEVKHGRIGVRDFEECMTDFLTETSKTYRNVLEEKENCGEIKEITDPFGEDAIDCYEQKVLAFVTGLQAQILSQFDTNGNQQKMKQAVAYIEEHYASDLNMAVVSNYLSMNYSLFSYSFKQYTGSNFVNYLRDIRMKEAKRLLAGTDMRIAEISQAVGYENEKHFMKLFKGCCGVSPSEYRRNMGFTGDES